MHARRCWEKALALDPDSAPLNAMLGFMHFADARFGWWDERDTARAQGRGAYIERALAIDPENPDAHRAVAGLSADAVAIRRRGRRRPQGRGARTQPARRTDLRQFRPAVQRTLRAKASR